MSEVFGIYLETVDLAGIGDMEPHIEGVAEAECYLSAFTALAEIVVGDCCHVRESENSTEITVLAYVKESDVEGSREDDVATIAIEANGHDPFMLTWKQARALVVALSYVESVGRRG